MMSVCFTLFLIGDLGEPNVTSIGFDLQEMGFLLEGCLTVKNQWGSLEDEITVRCGKVVMVDENVKRG